MNTVDVVFVLPDFLPVLLAFLCSLLLRSPLARHAALGWIQDGRVF